MYPNIVSDRRVGHVRQAVTWEGYAIYQMAVVEKIIAPCGSPAQSLRISYYKLPAVSLNGTSHRIQSM